MQLIDAVTLADAQVTDDGYLEARARTARTGIQLYSADEMGLGGSEVVRVYRPEASVFAKSSLNTFAGVPITVGHPSQPVTADSWKKEAVGEALDEVLRDGEWVKIGLRIKDAAAVKAVQDGTRQLSVGYTAEIEWVDGVTPEGEPYDAIQKNIKANHIAIVPRARAGAGARIGDADTGKDRATWGASPVHHADTKGRHMPDNLQTVVLGDKAVQVSAADTATIEAFKADQAKALADAEAKHKAEIDAKDAEIAKKDAEIEKLKDAQLSDADLDARVQARAKLVGDAAKIAKDVKVEGLSDADIRKAVVAAKLGDAAIKDRSDAYIEARFDVLAEDAGKADPVAGVLKDAKPAAPTSLSDAYAARDKALQEKWKQPQKQEA